MSTGNVKTGFYYLFLVLTLLTFVGIIGMYYDSLKESGRMGYVDLCPFLGFRQARLYVAVWLGVFITLFGTVLYLMYRRNRKGVVKACISIWVSFFISVFMYHILTDFSDW